MRNWIMLKWIALPAVLLLSAAHCGDDDNGVEPISGGPPVVEPDGNGDYATIQEAINAAAEGDTVMLANGTFRGEGNRDLQYLGKAILVISQGGDPDACVIDCQGSEAEPHRGFYFHMQEDHQSVLAGVKVINGWENSGGGIICTDVSSPTIINCVFADNTGADAGGGIHVHDQSDPNVNGCIFSGNTTQAAGGGIHISESSPSFTNCTIVDNTAAQAGGVAMYNSSPVLANCTISGNSPDGIECADSFPTLQSTIVAFNLVGAGVSCAGNCDIVLNCTDVFGNAGGDSTECIKDQFGWRGNFSGDPLFCSPQNGDFHLQSASPCRPENTGCGLIGAWTVGCR